MKTFQLTSEDNRLIGTIKGKTAFDVATWLRGIMTQSCPGWASVTLAEPVEFHGKMISGRISIHWQ